MSKNIRCWLFLILHVWVALITHKGLLHLPPSLSLYKKIVKHDSCRRSSNFLPTHLHTWYFIIFFTCFIQLAEKILEKTFYFFPLLLPAPGIPLMFLEKIQPIRSSRLVASLLSMLLEFHVEETPTTPSDNKILTISLLSLSLYHFQYRKQN